MQLLPSHQRSFCITKSFLSVDIPVAKIFQRDPSAGYRTGDEPAWLYNLEIGIEVAQFGFSGHRCRVQDVHAGLCPETRRMLSGGLRGACPRSGEQLKFDEIAPCGFGPVKRVVGAPQETVYRVIGGKDG